MPLEPRTGEPGLGRKVLKPCLILRSRGQEDAFFPESRHKGLAVEPSTG